MIDRARAARFGFFEVVRRQQQRDARVRQLREHVVDAVAALRIDADRRLVEQHDARAMEHTAGDVQPPPHAAGELFDRLARAIGKAGLLERPVHLRREIGPARPCRLPNASRFSRAVSSG